MELKLTNAKSKIELSDAIFSCEFNEPLIHQIVTAYMSAARAGTKSQKTRAEVRGGGAKPWKQKGTGRARAGTIRSPLWRKGGVVFAAKPRSFKQKINKKMYRGAFRSILSELIRQERLLIVDSFEIKNPKTKDFLQLLTKFKIKDGNVLIVSDAVEKNLYLSSRNIPYVEVKESSEALTDPVAFVRADYVVATKKAIQEIEGQLK